MLNLKEISVKELKICKRSMNGLFANRIETVDDLVSYGFIKLSETPNLGAYSNAEIWFALSELLIKKAENFNCFDNHEDDFVFYTRRKQIASAALQGLCANSELNSLDAKKTAELSIEMADALMDLL